MTYKIEVFVNRHLLRAGSVEEDIQECVAAGGGRELTRRG